MAVVDKVYKHAEYERNKHTYKTRHKNYYQINKDKIRSYMKQYSKFSNCFRRFNAYQILGGSCVRCNNDDPMVLQFNHINKDGNKHRKQMGEGSALLERWIINNPEEAVQKVELLCANCHAKLHSMFNSIEGHYDNPKKR